MTTLDIHAIVFAMPHRRPENPLPPLRLLGDLHDDVDGTGEGAIDANPVRKVAPPKRRVDPEEVLSRHNLHRTYHNAVATLADPAAPLRPTARRILVTLRDGGPQPLDQLAARLTAAGRRPIRPATVTAALGELHAADLAAVDDHDQGELTGRWTTSPVAGDPLLAAVDLHGAHDHRHLCDLAGGGRHPGPGD